MKKVIIVGSSRKDGNTECLVSNLMKYVAWDIIDLNDYTFGYYDYEHRNKDDDYIPLMKKVIKNYDVLIFATPVYWYSMSGIMKVFFDRMTDLITIEKELGRKLKGKKMAALSCSNGNNLEEQFWLPFSKTAQYLEMEYIGHLHTITNKTDRKKIIEFIHDIKMKST